MKEVWIPGLISIDFDDFTSPIERYIKHLRQCFISYPKTSNFAQNTPLRVVLDIPMKYCLSCLICYLGVYFTFRK